MSRILLFNKPFGVICQFGKVDKNPSLADFISVPQVYPAGRLDLDSEGLVLLTDNGMLQHRISDPRHKLPKGYWVQVEKIPTETALADFRKGLVLKDGLTQPASIERMDAPPPHLWERSPPIRVRKSIPDCWVDVRIREGKNRQVRRMTAHIGHPTLRLIRYAIGPFELETLAAGEWREVDPRDPKLATLGWKV